MASAKDIFYSIRLTDMFSGTIRQAGEHVQQFEGKVEHAKEKVSELGKEMLGAFVAFEAGEFLKESAHEFLETEANVKRLSLAIGARGGLASDLAELRKQADELQEKGIFDDDEALKIDQLGLQMGLSIEKVKQLTPIIEDVAARTGQASQSVLEAVLHGSQGMARGLIQFGVHLKDTGSKSKNLAIIVDQLKKSYEGANEEIAKTTEGGKITNLTNEWKDFQKKVGEDLLKVFDNLLPYIKEGIVYLTQFAEWIKRNGHEIKEVIKTVGELWLAFKVISGGIAIFEGISGAIAAMGVATGETTGIIEAFSVALDVTPLGLFATALGAIAVAYQLIAGNAETAKDAVNKFDQKSFDNEKGEIEKYRAQFGKAKGGDAKFQAFLDDRIADRQKEIDEKTKESDRLMGYKNDNDILANPGGWIGDRWHNIAGMSDEDKQKNQAALISISQAKSEQKAFQDAKTTTAAPGKVGGSEGGFAGSDASNAGGKASRAEGSKVTTINISINDLVKQITLSVTNLKESTGAVREAVAEALISAVNDSQRVAGT